MPLCRIRSRRNRDAPTLVDISRALRLVLLYPSIRHFPRAYRSKGLLRFQRNRFVLVTSDGGANLDWSLAQLGLLIGEEALFGAG
jgi:hypothetical protein